MFMGQGLSLSRNVNQNFSFTLSRNGTPCRQPLGYALYTRPITPKLTAVSCVLLQPLVIGLKNMRQLCAKACWFRPKQVWSESILLPQHKRRSTVSVTNEQRLCGKTETPCNSVLLQVPANSNTDTVCPVACARFVSTCESAVLKAGLAYTSCSCSSFG